MAQHYCIILSSFIAGLPDTYQAKANESIFGTHSTNSQTMIRRLVYLIECTSILAIYAIKDSGVNPNMIALMDTIHEQTRIIRNNQEAFAKAPEMYQTLAEETGRLFGACLKIMPTPESQMTELLEVCESASVLA